MILKYARNFVQTDTLINLYRSIKEPHFRYCSSVWGSCGASKLDVLQNVQNKAARIVTNSPFDASAASLLQRLAWPYVHKLINKETGSMVYRSLNSFAPQYPNDLFMRLSEVHPRALRNSKTNLSTARKSGNISSHTEKLFSYDNRQRMKRHIATDRLSKIYTARCGYTWLGESKWPQEWPISPITIIYLKSPSEKMKSFCVHKTGF